MSRPWKHPKTGVYWLRKAVPEDLRPLVGKREEKRTLGTRDPGEAKRLHALALAELEARWHTLRAGPKSLSEREAHELAAIVHDRWIALHRDNPSRQTFWPTDVGVTVFPVDPPLWGPHAPNLDLRDLDPVGIRRQELEDWCLQRADEILSARGFTVDEPGRLRLARSVAIAVQRASQTLARWSAGGFDAPVGPLFVPDGTAAAVPTARAEPLAMDALVKGWTAEKQPAERTVYEWGRVVRQLVAFLGHDDARRLMSDDLIRWKAALVEAGLRPKTIRDAKLAPIRAILQWAVDNRRIPTNPAERIVIDVKSKAAEAKRSFTNDEAAVILKAAAREEDAVRRWVPWLCAYSGARVAEICQLRKEDVLEVEGIACMRFTPEAGSLKTPGSERAVPLHPALIESGFLEFVAKAKPGPLFPELPPNRFGSRGGNGTKVLGRWVRSLGLTDGRLSPNHSWRHRLKTLGRRHGLAPDIVDAITGHRRKTVADAYGEFPMEALLRELSKIPAVRLG